MRAELTDAGFQELTSPEAVDAFINESEGTALLVVNSVCGCAAAGARPAARLSLEGEHKPDHAATVFAGMDKDAVKRAREHLLPYPPSSPSIALFKDGKLVHFIERHHIEGRPAEMIAENLKMAYADYCA